MPMTPALQKSMLDWVAVTPTTPTRPSSLWCGLSSATPTSISAYEIGTGSGYSRQPITFDPATVTNGGSDIAAVSLNANSMVFGPFSSSIEFAGFSIWNAQVGGSMLWFGSLQNGAAAAGGTARMPASVLTVNMG